MSDNNISSNGAIILFDALRNSNSSVLRIYLSRNRIDDESMTSLGEYIKNNKSLEGIEMIQNRVTDNGMQILSQYLIGNESLQWFSFQMNKGITDESIQHFCNMIGNSRINRLDIDGTRLTQKINIALLLIENILRYKDENIYINEE